MGHLAEEEGAGCYMFEGGTMRGQDGGEGLEEGGGFGCYALVGRGGGERWGGEIVYKEALGEG